MAESKTNVPSTLPAHASSSSPPTNPRGIPYAPFLTHVTDYVNTRADVQPTLNSFAELIAKYRFMETNTQRRLKGLEEKIPDISNTLDVVRFLRRRKRLIQDGSAPDLREVKTTFELNDTLFAKAVVDVSSLDEVFLWLGANVMLAYPLAEAEDLLVGKLEGARKGREASLEDLEFLREQITTLEVATARVYNWDVAQKRKEAESK